MGQPRVIIEVTTSKGKSGPPAPKILANVGSNWLSQSIFRFMVRMHYYSEWYRFRDMHRDKMYGPGKHVAITRLALNSTLAWAASEAEKLTGKEQEVTPSFSEAGDPDWTES